MKPRQALATTAALVLSALTACAMLSETERRDLLSTAEDLREMLQDLREGPPQLPPRFHFRPSTQGEREALIEGMRVLEADPLSDGARRKRKLLRQWLWEVNDVQDESCPDLLHWQSWQLEYPYTNEILDHMDFAAAAFFVEHPDKAADHVARYTAAVEGVLRFYSSILRVRPEAKLAVLEKLSAKRDRGKLVAHIAELADRERCHGGGDLPKRSYAVRIRPSTQEEREKFLEATRALEAEPLSEGAREKRESLDMWLLEVNDLEFDRSEHSCVEFLDSVLGWETWYEHYPYIDEIRDHMILAAAVFSIEHPDKAADDVARCTAAVEGVLRVYTSILRIRPEAKLAVLEKLIAKRDRGSLATHIANVANRMHE